MLNERVDIPLDNENVVNLKYPVEVKGFEKVNTLTFRRPKARDLKEVPVENLKMGDMLKLIAKLSNQPMPVIEEMDAADISATSKVISGFLNRGQETGENP